MTPEGKVKAGINRVLAHYGERLYSFMSVPNGYGKSTIDYLGCFYGQFFAIEAKRAGKQPTERQEGIIADIEAAGGKVFRIRDEQGLIELDQWLSHIELLGGGEP